MTAFRRWVGVGYACCLVAILLRPFDFQSPVAQNGAQWLKPKGIEFATPGIARSASATTRLTAALKRASGLTLEVWAAASGKKLYGPARIVSLSLSSARRNFTLGQAGRDLAMLLRTTQTNLSGYKPHLRVPDVFATTALQHIVVAYNHFWQEVYVNGRLARRAPIPGGDFSNWDTDYDLLLGNEATGDAPWLGRLYRVAIYGRAMSDREIARHYATGPAAALSASPDVLVALYDFAAGSGARIRDISGATPALELAIPVRFIENSDRFLAWPKRIQSYGAAEWLEIVANVLLFMPLGYFLYLALTRYNARGWSGAVTAVLAGGLLSLAVESAQFCLVGRASSLLDVLTNTAGAALGTALYACLTGPTSHAARGTRRQR